MTGDEISAIRQSLQLTQEQFTERFNINIKTYRDWERDARPPKGPALNWLLLIKDHPRIAEQTAKSARKYA